MHPSFFFRSFGATFILLCLLAFAAPRMGFAQNRDYRHVISANAALNGWQIIARADNLIQADTVVGAYLNASGTYGLSYDYGIAQWFSLGAQFTWNNGQLGADRIVINTQNRSYTGAAGLNLRRISVGLRPMFHYLNKDRFDLYTGFRLGLNFTRISLGAGTEDLTNNEILDELLSNNWLLRRSYNGVRPTVQFIPFGMRGYVTDRLAIGFEAALGPTYFLGAQLNYRI